MSVGSGVAGNRSGIPWPSTEQFRGAMQNLSSTIGDEELRQGTAAVNQNEIPLVYSGGFADVFKVHCPATGKTWAVRCFKTAASGLRERYREISLFLDEKKVKKELGFTVDFEYLDQGIRIQGHWYPIVKMHWVEGRTLNEFVAQHLDEPQVLKGLIKLWVRLSSRMKSVGMAHADLQHGNVILVPKGDQGQLLLRLIDYDGMWIPRLAEKASGELGHRHYQHPQRADENLYCVDVDRFSHLAIASALWSLRHAGNQLWERYNNDDNLLFVEADFLKPAESQLIRELWSLPVPEVHALVGQLILGSTRRLDQVPYLHELVDEDLKVRSLSGEQEAQVNDILVGAAGTGKSGMQEATPAPDTEFVLQMPPTRTRVVDGAAVFAPLDSTAASGTGVSGSIFDQLPEMTVNSGGHSTTGFAGNVESATAAGGLFGRFDQWLANVAGGTQTSAHNLLRVASVAAPTSIAATVLGGVLYMSGLAPDPSPVNVDAANASAPSIDVAALDHPAALNEESLATSGVPVVLPEEPQTDVDDLRINSIGMKLRLIEPGEFELQQSPNRNRLSGSFRVQFSRAYYIGIHEVTQAQYRDIVGQSPSRFSGDDLPVEQVSAVEADTFCQLLTERERSQGGLEDGLEYRLPTVAEWEYAARSGGPVEEADPTAWTSENSDDRTQPVGQLQANAWGLFDTIGNVEEWILDEEPPTALANEILNVSLDPVVVGFGGVRRVVRGGSWKRDSRGVDSATQREDDVGFRVVLANVPPDLLAIELNHAIARRDRTSAINLLQEIESRHPGDGRIAAWRPRVDQMQSDRRNRVEVVTNSLAMELMRIRAGEFVMGSQAGPGSSRPTHRVSISNDFFLGMREVSEAEFDSVMSQDPVSVSALPALVTHDDAISFCDRLTDLVKARDDFERELIYRLPTEAEWEYATRAGTETLWHFGDDETLAEYYACIEPPGHFHAVGQRLPNPWGLFDVVGNASEWALDGFEADYSTRTGAVSFDPFTPPTGATSHVVRDGRSGQPLDTCTSDHRVAGDYQSVHGFRVALALPIASLTAGRIEKLAISLESAMVAEDAPTASNLIDRIQRIDPSESRLDAWKRRLGALDDSDVTPFKPPGRVYERNALGLKLVEISAGEFVMGSDQGVWNESPPHRVRISRPFWIGMYEVTQQQYETLMMNNPSRFKGRDLPVENISFNEAEEFCRKLTEVERRAKRIVSPFAYQLPTEAEWEYAARAGTTTRWFCGETPENLGRYAWYADNSQQQSHPIGQKRPNAWGLYDVFGNVFEWTGDDYLPDLYDARSQELVVDPVSRGTRGDFRVDRGGSWHRSDRYCQSANRNGRDPELRRSDVGFRIVLADSRRE